MEKTNKSSRVLEIYQMFMSGMVVRKQDIAAKYQVNPRSFQRDIETIRNFLSEQGSQYGVIQTIEYDPKERGFKLVSKKKNNLNKGEMLALCKILIESRAFSKEQLESLLERILDQCIPIPDKENIEKMISNEIINYQDTAHQPIKIENLWTITEAIQSQNVIEISYIRLKDRQRITREVYPVGIIFSEFYFYMLAHIADAEKRKDFDIQSDTNPTIYRIDRIQEVKVKEDKFHIPYKDKFREGEYKNRNQFMYGGKLQTIRFRYRGNSIEAIIDKLPTARAEKENDGSYLVEAETFGMGILMWLLSQGSKVEVLSPDSLRNEWIEEARKIVEMTNLES